MRKSVEFFFDFGSPTAYLAWTQLPRIAAENEAEIIWRPMLLGGVFKATGNQPPVGILSKGRYMLQDLARFAKRYGVPLAFNPHFPINTLQLMRGAIGYLGTEDLQPYMHAIFDAIWVQRLDMSQAEVVTQVLSSAGLDPAEFQRLVNDPDIKARLKAATDEAVQRGVFGAPSFFVDDQLYFGQDRLDFVAEALVR